MKVYELITELSKRPAGDDVILSHNSNSYRVNTVSTEGDEGMTCIIGDGNYCVTEEDEIVTGKTKARNEPESRVNRQRTELATLQRQYEASVANASHYETRYVQPFWNWANDSPIASTMCAKAKAEGKTVVDVFREYIDAATAGLREEIARLREGGAK